MRHRSLCKGIPQGLQPVASPGTHENTGYLHTIQFVDILQQELLRASVLPKDYDFEAHKKLVPMQPGDVPVTYADTKALEKDYGYRPATTLREGLRKFAEWYKGYYMGKKS